MVWELDTGGIKLARFDKRRTKVKTIPNFQVQMAIKYIIPIFKRDQIRNSKIDPDLNASNSNSSKFFATYSRYFSYLVFDKISFQKACNNLLDVMCYKIYDWILKRGGSEVE